MAQKRMLDKKISVSEQVANLSTEAQLIFSWSIPHADDVGMLPYSKRTLKATIIPMKDMSLEDFGNHWESIVSQNLIETFEYGGKKFYRICTFLQNQTLKRDRQPHTILPFDFEERPKESWAKLLQVDGIDAVGIHLEDGGFQVEPEEKGREGKRREDILSSSRSPSGDAYGDVNFASFWELYPRKVGKGAAWRKWKQMKIGKILADKILASVREHIANDKQWKKDDGQFIPHPSTFLSQRRFDDEVQKFSGGKADQF